MLISVVTAAWCPQAEHLAQAYASLCEQAMPPGWRWEWLPQLDDDHGELPLPTKALTDPRVRPGRGPHGGPGVARTIALARMSPESRLIRCFDADDVLPPTALARAIEILSADPAVGWTTCAALDLLPDGSLVDFAGNPPAGRIPRGRGYDPITDTFGIGHPATVTIRRDLLLALGGWMALPTNEDLGLVASASAVADGWYIGEPGLYYRKHDSQLTQTTSFHRDMGLHRGLVAERVRVLGQLFGGEDGQGRSTALSSRGRTGGEFREPPPSPAVAHSPTG